MIVFVCTVERTGFCWAIISVIVRPILSCPMAPYNRTGCLSLCNHAAMLPALPPKKIPLDCICSYLCKLENLTPHYADTIESYSTCDEQTRVNGHLHCELKYLSEPFVALFKTYMLDSNLSSIHVKRYQVVVMHYPWVSYNLWEVTWQLYN